jgi:hypothetical protein
MLEVLRQMDGTFGTSIKQVMVRLTPRKGVGLVADIIGLGRRDSIELGAGRLRIAKIVDPACAPPASKDQPLSSVNTPG